MKKIKGNIIDLHNRKIYPGELTISGGYIDSIETIDETLYNYILPGFIDAHIHIESSMLVPYEFARIALTHGTVATISDPHEIANVLGIDGVHYMIENAREAKLKFHFGAPSCVPATSFETAGAVIDSDGIRQLMAMDEIFYLSEMMNYPGVLHKDPEVMRKLEIAKESGKPIDGHAPGLMGEQAKRYIEAGITTDHECFSFPEALNKLSHGMKVIIREGSAARNFDALHTLIKSHPEKLMFCSDDKHPDELMHGHINELVVRALELGYDMFDVLQIACKNPVDHYKMDVGLLRTGDKADMIVVSDMESFKVLQTYINGELVADQGRSFLPDKIHSCPNNFNISPKKREDFLMESQTDKIKVIHAIDGELITESSTKKLELIDGCLQTDQSKDILKISVVNRYSEAPVASG
ncbi:MAG: amidohydrolase family protein, partial [Bacteroidia bacterium]|nr:amidohydrolase family protein [Bacteroidia bacterium]